MCALNNTQLPGNIDEAFFCRPFVKITFMSFKHDRRAPATKFTDKL